MTADGGRPTTDASGASVLTPTVETGPPDVLLASWVRRVLAVWLDQALLAAVVFLAFPFQPVAPPPHYVPSNAGTFEPAAASWSTSGWVWAALLVPLVMQAYLGSTPGKLVVGIAVVRERDGRPIGALRTAGRLLAHLLDAILMIGYLRPLWNRRRQTFADSICGTVVLATRRPLPFRVSTPDHPPVAVPSVADWELPVAPAWRTRLTAAAVTVCVPGVLLWLGSSGQGATFREETCVVGMAGTEPPGTLVGGSVSFLSEPAVETRLGIERIRLGSDDGIRVGWEPASVPADDVVLRVTFARADGTGARVVEHVLRDGVVQPGAGEPLEDGRLGVVLPLSTLDGLGDGWTWTVTTVVDGRQLAECVPGPSATGTRTA